MHGTISNDAVIALVCSFVGGFLMTWFRGYSWFGEGVTYVVAILGGATVTLLLGATTGLDWTIGIMQHTLTVFGAVHVGGNLAKARATTSLPAAVMPEFNELSKEK
jgi:hypothetical protein